MRLTPDRLLLLSFASLIAIGTLALMLPVAAVGPPVRWHEALFTATSAVCVTGLAVADTGTRFTVVGQGIILALIQLGGLGILTFSSWILLAMGKRLSLRGSEVVSSAFHTSHERGLRNLVGRIVVFTFAIEAAGTLVLWARFAWDQPPGRALYSAVFHSISAFCNAGFSLYSDSVISYRGDYAVNLALMGLIVLGGLGFAVQNELFDRLRAGKEGPKRRLSLHTRLVMVVTVSLILAGAVSFAATEFTNTLGKIPFDEKILTSLFQSVTTRTAGFNSVDIGALSSTTLCVMIFLMFVGGSPGSTAGGIKTTTLAVLLALMRGRARGRRFAEVYGRQIPPAQVSKAIGVLGIGLAAFAICLFGLQITESMAYGRDWMRARFLDYAFETMSALGTVGLSTGVTPTLSVPGRLIIVLAMFAGRLGPLTFAFSLVGERTGAKYELPEEPVMVG